MKMASYAIFVAGVDSSSAVLLEKIWSFVYQERKH